MNKEDMLNMDSNILVSIINMKLRDFYPSLKDFCEDIGIDINELQKKLSNAGYEYNEEQCQFK